MRTNKTGDNKTGYVNLDWDMVMEKISTIPDKFTLHARNPEFNSVYGGTHTNFTLVASAPNCSDLDSGRRVGNLADYCKFLKLGQTFNVIGAFSGYPVEPVDLPAHTRHLDACRAFITPPKSPGTLTVWAMGKLRMPSK